MLSVAAKISKVNLGQKNKRCWFFNLLWLLWSNISIIKTAEVGELKLFKYQSLLSICKIYNVRRNCERLKIKDCQPDCHRDLIIPSSSNKLWNTWWLRHLWVHSCVVWLKGSYTSFLTSKFAEYSYFTIQPVEYIR